MIANNIATGTSAPRGESDKANSPATYTINAMAANRPSVAISLMGLLINCAPCIRTYTKTLYVEQHVIAHNFLN